MKLTSPIQELKGVGEKSAQFYARLGIQTVGDLLWHVPRRYNDYSIVSAIDGLEPGAVTVKGVFESVKGRYVRRGLHITEGVLRDDSGAVRVVWFNQPYRANAIKADTEYYLSGEYQFSNRRYQILNPSAEMVSEFQKNAARIVPIYPETKGLTSHQIRKVVAGSIPFAESVVDALPDAVRKAVDLISLPSALTQVHFPDNSDLLKQARRRLAFDELFAIILASELNRAENATLQARSIPFKADETKAFVATLPFALTNAQRRAAWDILQDLTKEQPMNRLLEGDVGSGKTVVAGMAVAQCASHGVQTLLMAPTEILATQHMQTLQELLEDSVRMEIITGSTTKAEKTRIKKALKAGEIDLIVGTHALIEDNVEFHTLGLAIIDEQHRFGVNQRAKLQQKAGDSMPHMLSMTATPIPRSLALTVYGELDVSIIDELPPGRKPTISKLVAPNSRKQVHNHLIKQLKDGKQAFIVYPLVEESETIEAGNVTAAYDHLRKTVLKDFSVGLLHGRMAAADKQQVMDDFLAHKIDVLVATTVIEVGVNVPNANTMIIEGAERFGLAQLHQLRGRVGRSRDQAYCYVIPTSSTSAQQRLKNFVTTQDGFALAELDLATRGPGEIYGKSQSGALDMRIAKLSDMQLIRAARQQAKALVADDPDLVQYPLLRRQVRQARSMTYLN